MSKSQDAFRTISEVADWLETPAHVLRFWESRFTQVKPVKRAGGRRYYRPADMELLSGIKKLLHEDGMTIKGVQKLLRAEGIKHVAAMGQPLDDQGLEGTLVQKTPERTADEILEATREAVSIVPIEPPIDPPSDEEVAPTSQVISFPTPPETPVETPRDSVVPDMAEPPRQASFLDDIPEIEDAFETSEFVAESSDTPASELEPAPVVDAQSVEDVSAESHAADDTPQEPDGPSIEDVPTIEHEQVEAVSSAPAEITSVSQLNLPDPSEIPEITGGYSSGQRAEIEEENENLPPSETVALSDVEKTERTEIFFETAPEVGSHHDTNPEPDDTPTDEDLDDLAALDAPETTSPVEPSTEPFSAFVGDEPAEENLAEPEPEDTPSETPLNAEVPTDSVVDIPEDALPDPDISFEVEATDDAPLEATEDPTFVAPQGPPFVGFEVSAPDAEKLLLDESSDEPVPTPENIPEDVKNLAEEDTPDPEEPASDLDAAPSSTAPEPTEVEAPAVIATTARYRLTRRAAPFSDDKKSELAELTARLSALRKTYGTVSKPTSKN